MASLLAKMAADFQTTLATKLSVGGTTCSLQTNVDSDGVTLPDGTYFLTFDRDNSQKEHFVVTKTGVNLTAIKSVSRQGVQTVGAVREHRIGATVGMTDFAHIMYHNNLLNGTTPLDSTTPLKYDGAPTFTYGQNQLVTWDKSKDYTDSVAIAGAPNANTTTKGIVEEATQAEVDAKTQTGGTGAELFVNPSNLRATKYNDYAADAGGTDAYAITLTPPITAYTTGQVFQFKANTANTGACTLNVDGLGAIAIKKGVSSDLDTGDILANQIVQVQYDGTSMQFQSLTANTANFATKAQVQTGTLLYGSDAVGTDSYAITLSPAPSSLDVGMVVNFKPLVSNTGAATLNVNGLGAKSIFKNYNQQLNNGDIQSGQMISLMYDGTNFQMQSPIGGAPRFFNGSSSRSGASGAQTITGVGFTPKCIIFHSSGVVGGARSVGSGSWTSNTGVNSSNGISVNGVTSASGPGTPSISVAGGDTVSGNYQEGFVSATSDDGFTISWTQIGAGSVCFFTYTCFG